MLSGLACQQVAQSNNEISQARLTELSDQVKTLLKERLEIYERGLISVRSAIRASGEEVLKKKEFNEYVSDLDMQRTFPGTHGFGFIRRVPKDFEKQFVSDAIKSGDLNFSIKQINPHDGDKWIIERLEPIDGNNNAIGLDMASEPKRLEAINNAILTNKPALTPPLTLVQALDKKNMGFVLILPINGPALSNDIIGLTYLPLLIDEVLAGGLINSGDFVISISDVSEDGKINTFYTNKNSSSVIADNLYQYMNVNAYGRLWRVEIDGTAAFINRLALPSPLDAVFRILIVGILASLLLYISLLYIRRQAHALIDRTLELDRARKDLQTIFDALPSIISYWDCDLRNRMANKSYISWFGINPENMTGMKMRDIIGDALFEHNEPYIKRALKGEYQIFEERFTVHGERSIAASVNYIPDFVDGVQRGFYVIAHDMTDFKDSQSRLERVLRENEVLLSTLNQQLLYSVTDSKGIIIEVNDNFCGISGYSRDELIGQSHRIINSGEHDRKFWKDVWRTIAQGNAWHNEVCNRAKDGSLYWVDTVIAPFIGADGKVERYVSMRTDVTARHSLDDSLREATLIAETASQAKSEFLANMSHEIRTPMNGILGFGYLLERQAMSPAALSMVQKIQSASQSLLGIIDDILDFSKIEAGRLTLDESSFDLSEVVEQLASLMSGSVSDRSIDLIIDSPPVNAKYLVGDMMRLTQILRNLVSNALKFTHTGEVSIAIDEISTDLINGTVLLRFIVKDTGSQENISIIKLTFDQWRLLRTVTGH